MNLHDNLIKRSINNELAHFYILETSQSGRAAHDSLFKFVHRFIQDYYQKVENQSQILENLMNHPDVYVLGNHQLEESSEEKFFKVEDAQAFARFFEFKPVQAKRKFAIITEGHRINSTVANKWLKLLEEPQGTTTIFLLNPRGVQLLPTIHSRAIHLRLAHQATSEDFATWLEFVEKTKQMSLAQFLETYARGDKELGFWVNELIRWESQKIDHATPKEALQNWLRTFQEMETFHQPLMTKWSLFYHHLNQFVLPRI